jgi:hypothetical protein
MDEHEEEIEMNARPILSCDEFYTANGNFSNLERFNEFLE